MSTNPVIIIPAIGQSKLVVLDENGNKVKNAWPFEIDEKALLDDMKGSLMKMMLFRTDGGFSDKVAGIADGITEPLAVNPDGTKKYSLKSLLAGKSYSECNEKEQDFIKGVFPVDGLAESLGADKIFYFDYDFFGDIADTASALDALVADVLAKTESEKVDFIVFSTGAAVLKAYLKDYAVKSCVEKVVCIAAFLDGASIVADIYENKLHIDNPAELLSSLGGKAASLASVVGMLPPDVMENIITKSVNVMKKNILDNCTSLWALIPAGRFEAVAAAYDMAPALKEKVSSIYEYSCNFKNEIKALEENGMKFCFVCCTGRELPCVFESAGTDSDGIVDTASASLDGAYPENTHYFDGTEHFSAMKNDAIVTLIENFLRQ